jgi:hypothetical protein
MADTEDNEFDKELADAFAAEEAAADPKNTEKPAEDPKKPEDTAPAADPSKEEPKDDEQKPKAGEDDKSGAGDEGKPKEGTEPPKDPNAPSAPEAPATPEPLTKADVADVITKIRDDERSSTRSLEGATQEVMEAYYPDGLSNVLVDQSTGRELRTPQDVVEASNGEMTTEEAAQWLMNEQYKLDQSINKIKEDARSIAETTLKFKQDSTDVLTRYEPLFKAYPTIQNKVWDQYKKLIKADEAKGVILQAPDMREFYDTVLEPYRLAFEYAQKQSATNPVDDPKKPEAAPTPGADDRLDEGGDGGTTPVDDPNDFAQQVKKELAKGL